MTGSVIEAKRGAPVLSLQGVTKRFGSSTALDDVSFQLESGTVHALLGENGAGKTTLMRIAFGLISADSGQVVAGTPQTRVTSPSDAIEAGVGMVHQHFTNVPAMTVAENVLLGGHGRFDRRRAAERVIDIGTRAGLPLDPHALAGDLPVGAQQRLEIVKALEHDARVLILDEPTAVLAPGQAADLLRWLRGFADRGNSVVLITHKLSEALAIADEVTVLRRGRVVVRSSAQKTNASALAAALLGDDLASQPSIPLAAHPGEIVARIENGTLVDERGVIRLTAVDLAVRAGELIGVAAVEGAGHRELLLAMAGRTRLSRGTLRLPQAIGFVPEDRHRDGLVLDFAPVENVALKGAGTRRGHIDWSHQHDRTKTLVREYDVRGGEAEAPVRTLSGGNQQKLILARELDGSPALLVVDNPTRGLDIRATQAVHDRLRIAAAAGAAIVLYSSDLDEVLALATRVVVLHGGHLRECAPERDIVGRAMLGVA